MSRTEMLSRVAENLYWMGRYVERAENVARLLNSAFYLELDAPGLVDDGTGAGPVEGLLAILGCREEFEQTSEQLDRDTVIRYLTFDRKCRCSILHMIARARENARGSQETISAEVWRQVNRFYLYLSGPRASRRLQASPTRLFDLIMQECVLFAGQVDSTLPRDQVFHFIRLGRYLERVEDIGRIIRAKAHTLDEDDQGASAPLRMVHWTSLLRSCSATEAYLRTYHERVEPESVVRYLVLDSDFPQALRFCIGRCLESLHEISGSDEDAYGSEAERLLGRLDGELRYIDIDEIFDRGLARFLDGVQEACHRVGEEIQRAYFLT